jgi:hypothetical protein
MSMHGGRVERFSEEEHIEQSPEQHVAVDRSGHMAGTVRLLHCIAREALATKSQAPSTFVCSMTQSRASRSPTLTAPLRASITKLL